MNISYVVLPTTTITDRKLKCLFVDWSNAVAGGTGNIDLSEAVANVISLGVAWLTPRTTPGTPHNTYSTASLPGVYPIT